MTIGEGRRRPERLSAESKWEICLQVASGAITQADAACSAAPVGATIAPATGASRTVTHTVAADTTVTVTATCTSGTSTAAGTARFTADAAPVPDVEISGLDHASATPDTDAASVEVSDTFGVTPAAAQCRAQATAGTPQVAPATGASRTVTLDVAAGTTVWVIVICNHHTNRDLAATRFTAHPAPTDTSTATDTTATTTPPTTTTPPADSEGCDTPLGALTATTATITGTLAAADGCTSTRHPRKTGSSVYQARRHTFTLTSPGWVTITLESAATNTQRIDAYLIILRGHTPDGAGTYITHNDDAANASRHGLHWRDSHLADVFLHPGSYTIEATTYHAHSTTNPARTTGDYNLTVDATLTGLQASYDAYAGREFTIEFDTGTFTPAATVPGSGLTASATKSGTMASLSVTPSRTGSLGVTLSFSRISGASSSSTRSTRSATVRSAAVGTYAITIDSTCPAGQIDSPHGNGTCSLSESELLKVKGNQGRYHVTPALVDGVTAVAADSLRASTHDCDDLTAARLAAVMVAIGIWETRSDATAVEERVIAGESVVVYRPGDNKRDPARSLMSVSRRDTHANLYPPGRTPTRAFWHPGVGYWQLDNWPAALSLNHYQRADVYEGGREVTDVLRDAYCKPTRFNGGTTGGFTRAERIASLKFQLDGRAVRQRGDPRPGGWRACKGATTGRDLCWETAELIYIGVVAGSSDEALYVTTAGETDHTDQRGGVHMMHCRWGSTGTPIRCGFYDTGDEEGLIDDADIEGTIGTNAKSPLAVPFMSLTHSSKRFAVFPQSFTGGAVTRVGYIANASAVRVADLDWAEEYSGGELEVQICAEYSGGPPSDSDCVWVATTASDFATRIRTQYPVS